MAESMAGKILTWLWDKKDEIREKLLELRAWFRKSPTEEETRSILLLGPGGVGKTTLGKLLTGDYDLLFDVPGSYMESLNIERYTLDGSPETEIVVPPGQLHRREATWPELQADIGAGKFRGIILLAAYGYHTLGPICSKQHRLYQGNKDSFVEVYLTDRRADEVAVLRQLTPFIRVNPNRMWFLTLVTKQDLWWPQRIAVEQHYRDGAYGTEIQQVLGQQDPRRIRHEVVFASLVISNFTTGTGERLKPNVEGYDHQLQVESLRRLFETVDGLRTWESLK